MRTPGDMMLDASVLTDVLPSDRLLVNGVAIPAVRADLRRIPNARNAVSVAWLWTWVLGLAAVAGRVDYPLVWVVAAFITVTAHVRCAILMHEAAHRLLFSKRRANDLVGRWLLAAPAWTPLMVYRRSHFAHHREEFGPDEPDIAFYSGYRTTPRVLARRLIRDAVGISGWKNLRALLRAIRNPSSRRVAAGIVGAQVVLAVVFWLVSGHWFAWVVLWFVPWMTGWRVVNRLRSLGEHGGLGAGADRRVTTHNVRQHLWARIIIVPYNTGWHLAHHVDMGIPFRNLPRFHEELVSAGYITDSMTYRSYPRLWRALVSMKQDNWRPLPTAGTVRRAESA
jgi:fatty acid desaturase